MTCWDPFQTELFLDSVKLFGNTGDSSGSDMWPPSLTALCSQKPVGGWAGRGLLKGSKMSCLGFEERGWWSAL